MWLSKVASRVQLEQARAGAEERLMRLNDVEATVADFNTKVLCSSRAVHCIALHCIALHCISGHFNVFQCSAVHFNVFQCSEVQFSVVQCSEV